MAVCPIQSLSGGRAVWSHTVVFGERGQRRLQCSPQPAKCGRLLLHDFVVESDDLPCAAGNRA